MKKILFLSLIMLFSCSTVFADFSWSDSPKSITDSEFKEIIEQYTEYDVSGEDFTTYTGNYTYNNVLNAIFKDTYHKAFFDMGDNKVGIRYKTSAWNLSLSGQKYNLDYLISLVFDFTNKTLNYQSIDTNTTYFADKGWVINLEDVTTIDWQSEAYQSNLIYDSFFLVLGQFYGTEGSLLNQIWDFEVNTAIYNNDVYTGNILFSENNVSWLTTNLSENFLSNNYKYYAEFYSYDSSGVSRNASKKELIKEINITELSIYQPTLEEVNNAIKKDSNYQDYSYTVTLYIVNGEEEKKLLESDLFIINSQPLAEIQYFVLKYEYFNYSPYIGIGGGGGSSSGDNITIEDVENIISGVFDSDTSNINSGDSSVLTDNNFQIEDPTENIIFGTFQNIANVMTSVDNSPIETTFMGEPIILRPDVWKVPDGPLKALFVAYFCYWVGKSIILDIRKTINKFKEGNFESIATEDISANMV